MGAFSNLAAQFDPVNRKRKGDQFEAVCKWFLENDTGQYRKVLRKVWLWKDWPGNWGVDAGIDLVAEDTEGRLWAIQAKAYEGSITRGEVNKFLAEASRFDFAYKVLMATTDKLSPIAQKTMEDLGATFIGLTELEDFTDWPAKLTDLRPVKLPKPKKPWDYQRTAIKEVVKGFETSDRGQLIMACGTGKTLTAWFIREQLAAERTLVLVPSLSLLKQTLKEWRIANPKEPFEVLPVCSDDTVRNDEDAAISHISYLGEPAEVDPAKIATFLRRNSGPRVVFCTYQSSPQIAAAFNLSRVPAFDLVIADEAHRVAGPLKSDFATILDARKIKADRRLFMTATPRVYSSRAKKAGELADYEYASMDDPVKFGKVFHRLGFSQAIEQNLLTDYQVAIIGVDDATYRDWAERGDLVTLEGTKIDTDARSLAGQIGLAKAMRKYDLNRIITFHGRVSRAREFAKSMPAVLDWMPARQRPKGKLWSKYASGDMSAGERHILLQHLKRLDEGERGLLANARCLAEGVDVPALDGVAFIDPRQSEVDIVQAVGRAIRKSDTKNVGTIVIPVFIDTTEDPERALDNDKVFKPVWDVVRALRSHDDELGRQLDDLRRRLGRRKRGRPRLPGKIHDDDLILTVGDAFARAFETRLVEQTTASWEFWFGLMEDFVVQEKTALVPQGFEVDGYRLGGWVNNQRSRYDRGELSSEQRSRLEALPGWSWHPHVDRWEANFACLARYVEAHGDLRRMRKSSVFEGFELGNWVEKQRWSRNHSSLPADREARLAELPGWMWDPFNERWEIGFQHLLQYVELNGGAKKIGQRTTIDGFKLGTWVNVQRTNRLQGKLDPERERRLSEVHGWTWNQIADRWPDAVDHVREYVHQNGTALVPRPYVADDGHKTGEWVHNRRLDYSRGILDPDRKKELEGIPGWSWDPLTEEWERNFGQLSEYGEKYGSVRVIPNNPALQRWLNRQRASRTAGTLDPAREQRLQALPGWVWSMQDQWDEGYELLEKYIADGGVGAVPFACVFGGYNLGQWVARQRARYVKGTLSRERIHRLERVEGWAWDINSSQWDEGYRHLAEYVEQHGKAFVKRDYVSDDGYNLGAWAKVQRDRRKKGKAASRP